MTKQGITYPKLSEGTLTPAYGRDYKTKKEVIKDFRAGKDFKFNHFNGSVYCSIRDGVVGEMVKLCYDKGIQALFYTITATDFMTEGKG